MQELTHAWPRVESATEPLQFENLFSDAKILRSSFETKWNFDDFGGRLGVPDSGAGLRNEEVMFLPPTPAVIAKIRVEANSVPMQIWEGTVIELHGKSMDVSLVPKLGASDAHTAEVDLDWVSPQDRDLVFVGSVFYLTLYRKSSPSVENSEELRFRRRPSWSATQIETMKQDALLLRQRMGRLAKTAE